MGDWYRGSRERQWKCVNCNDVFPTRSELENHKRKCIPVKDVFSPSNAPCTCYTHNGHCDPHEGNC